MAQVGRLGSGGSFSCVSPAFKELLFRESAPRAFLVLILKVPHSWKPRSARLTGLARHPTTTAQVGGHVLAFHKPDSLCLSAFLLQRGLFGVRWFLLAFLIPFVMWVHKPRSPDQRCCLPPCLDLWSWWLPCLLPAQHVCLHSLMSFSFHFSALWAARESLS